MILSFLAVVGLGAAALAGGSVAALQPLLGVVFPYAAFLVFFAGILTRVAAWGRSPVPFRIPTTCGQQRSLRWIRPSRLDNPSTALGAIGRVLLEALLFRSLFRNTRADLRKEEGLTHGPSLLLWLAALSFHWAMLVVLVRHLRLFLNPVPEAVHLVEAADGFLQTGLPTIHASAAVLLAALLCLLGRRLLRAEVRYISLPQDWFPLFLLLAIGGTGLWLQQVARAPIADTKEFVMGLAAFRPVLLAGLHPLFFAHVFLVCVLLAWFPFSKLVHMPGVFLSPTRNMASNSRAKRHVNPWNPEVEVHSYAAYEDEFRDRMKAAGIPVEKE